MRLARFSPAASSSVDVWPVILRTVTFGPVDAARYAQDWRRRTAGRSDSWVDPLHQVASAAIAFEAGRWDDAAAEFDAGLEEAERTELGWMSRAVAARAALDAARGNAGAAARRISAFRASGRPDLLGLPDVDLVEASLLTASEPRRAAELVARTWAAPSPLWRLLAGPASLRIAHDLGNAELAGQIADRLSDLSKPRLPAGEITAPTLIVECEGDFTGGQGATLRSALTCPAQLIRLTAAQGAGGHCAGLGQRVWADAVYPWIAETLAHNASRELPAGNPAEAAH